MFSGIIQACVPIVGVDCKPGLSRITLDLDRLAKGLKRGASVSAGGVCLTAVAIKGSKISFEAMQETLDKTTLGAARKGDKINIERSMRFGDEIGGHIVSGHVDGTAKIIKNNTFNVHFIPETLRVTTFGLKKEGDMVNVEVDRLTMAVVETAKNIQMNSI